MKMSVPRRELLAAIVAKQRSVNETYPPLKWLLAEKLVRVVHEGKYGSKTYGATDAGRKALAESEAA